MKKFLIQALALGLFLGTMSAVLPAFLDPPAATAEAHGGGHGQLKWDSKAWRTCKLPYSSDAQVKKLIRCGVDHFPVPGGVEKATRIAGCESGFEHWVHNGGCCAGIYQQHLSYWSGRVAKHNRVVGDKMDVQSSWSNGRSNVLVSMRMAHRYGWDDWSCS